MTKPPPRSGPPRRPSRGGPARPDNRSHPGKSTKSTPRTESREGRQGVEFRPRVRPVRTVAAAPQPRAHQPGTPQRVAKLLARAGVGSRRDVERMIAEGRVKVDGQVLTSPALNLASLQTVTVDDKPVEAAAGTRLYRFHKPAGCLTTARDPKGRATIYDLLPKDLPRLVTIGRLDYNTEGLLLLTNDGELKRAMELPANALPRRYRVRVHGTVSQRALEALAEGVTIDDVRYGPIDAGIERRSGTNLWLNITLTEGKNREIRKVMEHIGLQVTRLIRVGYGPFALGDMPVRGVDEAPADTVRQLKERLKIK